MSLKEPFTSEERALAVADGMRKLNQAVGLLEAAKIDLLDGVPLNADTPSPLRTRDWIPICRTYLRLKQIAERLARKANGNARAIRKGAIPVR